MRLYIDKGNLESYVLSAKSNTQDFALCNKMLKKHFDMHLNMSLEDFAGSQLCMTWGNTLLDGNGNNIIHFDTQANIRPIRPFNANTFNTNFDKEDYSAVFLLENESTAILEEHGNYLVGSIGQEIKTLKKLIIGDEEELYSQTLMPIEKFFAAGEWEGLNNSILPCSDIIIADSYLLSNPKLYNTNLIALLRKVTKHVVYSNVNIVIFCLPTKDKNGDLVYPDYGYIRDLIKSELGKLDIEAIVTFVTSDSEKDFEEHDRTLCTNYIYYTPGPGFTIYDSQGKLTTRGRAFHVHSCAKGQHFLATLDFINDMQSLISDIESGNKKGRIDKDNDSKLCNFLHFS